MFSRLQVLCSPKVISFSISREKEYYTYFSLSLHLKCSELFLHSFKSYQTVIFLTHLTSFCFQWFLVCFHTESSSVLCFGSYLCYSAIFFHNYFWRFTSTSALEKWASSSPVLYPIRLPCFLLFFCIIWLFFWPILEISHLAFMVLVHRPVISVCYFQQWVDW